MINITDDRAKIKIAVENNRLMLAYEIAFANELSKILGMQYESAAKRIEAYNMNFEEAINNYNPQLREIYKNNLKRVMSRFGQRALDFAGYKESKSPFTEFMAYMNNYIAQYVALKVVTISTFTNKIINRIIKRGHESGWTNQEMANKIRDVAEISKMSRARTIARTETHSAAMNSFQGAMDKTRMVREKEWVSIEDSRTRTKPFNHARANGERVGMDNNFFDTGEALRYPGDMENGSAGNVINCRCNMMFFTNVNIQEQAA